MRGKQRKHPVEESVHVEVFRKGPTPPTEGLRQADDEGLLGAPLRWLLVRLQSATTDIHQLGSSLTTSKMTDPAVCPACSSSQVERSMHGGLFSDRCAICGWESSGTYSPTIEGLSPSPVNRVRVRWLEGDVAPRALKVLREASPLAKGIGLADLSALMAEGRPFDLGVVAEHARAQLSRQLEQAGFIVTTETAS